MYRQPKQKNGGAGAGRFCLSGNGKKNGPEKGNTNGTVSGTSPEGSFGLPMLSGDVKPGNVPEWSVSEGIS